MPDRMLADYDALVYFMPLRAYAATAFAEGRLPLWNPHSFGGSPFLANPQTALFYPFTWLFAILSIPHAYGVNLALHVLLAGLLFFACVRVVLGVGTIGAAAGAAAFMLSGALSGQYGHLNQISAVAWLPALLLVTHRLVHGSSATWMPRTVAAFSILLALQLFAGHPQQTFMALLICGLYFACTAYRTDRTARVRAAVQLTAAVVLGAGLAAVQLIPTAELAGESVRGGGLSFREAVAESLWPWLVARALMPSFVNDLGSTEILAYVGVAALLGAILALGVLPWRRLRFPCILALLGLLLALGGANPAYPLLYDLVPGFSSFRVPARWLLIYVLGVAMLAALAVDWLALGGWRSLRRAQGARLIVIHVAVLLLWLAFYVPGVRASRELVLAWVAVGLIAALAMLAARRWRWRTASAVLLTALIGVEVLVAGADLAPRHPVPIEAFAQPRDSTLFLQSRIGTGRILSIASDEYELKEAPDYREWFSHLQPVTLNAFLVAAKRNEMLTPNLHLLYRLSSVDGYDGGLLPTRSWLSAASLLVPAQRLRADGVLSSRLQVLPPRSLMDLFSISTVLSNRARDYYDGLVEYDRAIISRLQPGQVLAIARLPERSFTSVGLLTRLSTDLPTGSIAAAIVLEGVDGTERQVEVFAGIHTGAGNGLVSTSDLSGAQAVRALSDGSQPGRLDFLARLPIPTVPIRRLRVENRSGSQLDVQAITLLDDRDGATAPLVLDDEIERTSFFEMKVYEYRGVAPRAMLVPETKWRKDEVVRTELSRPEYNPRKLGYITVGSGVGLEGSVVYSGSTDGEYARVVRDDPEAVDIQVNSAGSTGLIVSDQYFPGWRAFVDGREVDIKQTNLAFRYVEVFPGQHRVELRYEPLSFRVGVLVTLCSLVLVAMFCYGRLPYGPRRAERSPL